MRDKGFLLLILNFENCGSFALEKQLETEKDATKIEEINKQITELRAKLENKSEEE